MTGRDQVVIDFGVDRAKGTVRTDGDPRRQILRVDEPEFFLLLPSRQTLPAGFRVGDEPAFGRAVARLAPNSVGEEILLALQIFRLELLADMAAQTSRIGLRLCRVDRCESTKVSFDSLRALIKKD